MYNMNINCLLKDVKSKISADFICSNNKGIIITSDKTATMSNLNIMEKYVKDIDNINLKNISNSCLL